MRLLQIVFLFVVLFAAPSQVWAKNCDSAYIPPAGAQKIWHCANDSDTVVVFVHGLHSSTRSAWLREPAAAGGKQVYWPNLVLADGNLKKPSVYLASFYTSLQATGYGMDDAAEELFVQLNTRTSTQPAVLEKKNIFFVAHSLGGILTRKVLVKYANEFAGKRVGLLLVASPSGGSAYAKYLAPAASLTEHQIVEQLQTNSPYLKLLHGQFLRLREGKRLPGLVGTELAENHLANLETRGTFAVLNQPLGFLVNRLWGTRIVEKISAHRYFSRQYTIGGSDHFTIAQPIGLNHGSHSRLVELYQAMLAQRAPECEIPPGFKLVLDVKLDDRIETGLGNLAPDFAASLPLLKVMRLKPNGTFAAGVTQPVPRNPATKRHVYAPTGAFPCAGEKFRAKFLRLPITARMETASRPFSDLCFKRSQARRNEPEAFMRCVEGKQCVPDAAVPGMAEPCGQTGWRWPSFISTAKAQTAAHWVAPSLVTLASFPVGQRPGYTEFTVRSGPIAGVANATHLTYGLSINGVPMHFDGLPPHVEPVAYNGAGGLHLTFATENLGFTGQDTGFERLALEIKYWQDDRLLKTALLARDYVSYRHAPPEMVRDGDSGDTYEWLGFYRPAQVVDRFEVLIDFKQRPANILKSKRQLGARQKRYKARPFVGVIRPPRDDNKKWYGLAFGIKLPSGQVNSTFAGKEAQEICRWIRAALPKWVSRGAYIYEFPAEAFTATTDRGKISTYCRDVT